MNQPTPPTATPSGLPAVDVMAVLAAMQDELDDLAATVAAQQSEIERLTRAVRRGTS